MSPAPYESSIAPALLLALLTAIPMPSLADDESEQAIHRVETEHLRIEWRTGQASPEAVERAQHEGEELYRAIHELLGHGTGSKVVILLEGPAQRSDGSWRYPHVDSWGRIHLYRFGPDPGHYFSALAHEMIHTFRIHRVPHHSWFFEEGLAEMVARRVDGSLSGFPWYGFSPTLVAGQWLESGEAIPLAMLRSNHRRLNLPCKAQSYSLRGSFFDWLGNAHGIDRLMAMANEPRAGTIEQYRRYFGKSFDSLVDSWKESLAAELDAIDDAEEQARRYRTETPVRSMNLCRRGEDF